jgi:hypothetical protein
MARTEIRFSRSRLLGWILMGLPLCLLILAVAWGVSDHQLMRFRILRLFGPDAVRWLLGASGLYFLAAVFGAMRRLLGGRPIAAIRYDGLELNGIFMSRYIPWRSLDALRLKSFGTRGQTHLFIAAVSRCPPGGNPLHHWLASRSYGVATRFADLDEDGVRQWLRDATAAGIEATTTQGRAEPVAQPPRHPVRAGFGRRIV